MSELASSKSAEAGQNVGYMDFFSRTNKPGFTTEQAAT
jgi:hypothetical protein